MAPTDAGVLSAATETLGRAANWEQAVTFYLRAADATQNDDDKVLFQAIAAELLERHVKDLDRAKSIAARLETTNPDHFATLRAAAIVHAAEGTLEALVNRYEDLLKTMRRKPGEIEMLTGLGELVWRRIGDLDRAEGYFKRLKLADSKNLTMLEFYGDYYAAQNDWQRLLTALQSYKSAVEGTEKELEIVVTMADTAENKLNNPAKAIDVWKQVLRADPGSETARAALSGLYARTKKWNALLELYKEDIGAMPDEAVAEKVEIYEKMVEIYRDQLRLDVMVINTYNAILEIDPNNQEAVDALAERFEQAKRWNDLLGVLTRKAEACKDVAESVTIYWRIADLWRNNLGNVPRAIEALEKIVELDPKHADALNELHQIYEQRNTWDALFIVLGKQALLLEGKERTARLHEQASLAEQRLRDNAKAIEAWENVATYADDPTAALEKLEELYAKDEAWDRLVTVYERILARQSDAEDKIYTLNKLAKVHADARNDEDEAVATWRRMAALPGGQPEAFPLITEVYVRNENWEPLIDLYAKESLYEDLFEILDAAAADLMDSDDQIALYQRLAQLAEDHLEDDDKVVQALEAILDIDGTHVETAHALLPYYRKSGNAIKEAEANQIILTWTSNEEEMLALMREIGSIYEEKLGQLGHAFDWFAKALRKAPQHADLRTHFEDLAARADAIAKLVEHYKEVAVAEEHLDENTRIALWRTIARASMQHLDDPHQALLFWEKIHAKNAEDVESIDALEHLYRVTEKWEALLETLDKKMALTSDDGLRVQLSFKRAALLVSHLDRFEEAAKSYNDVIAVDPKNLDALRGLKAIFARKEQWDKLTETLEIELSVVDAERGPILVELGDVCLKHLNQAPRAIAYFFQLLDEEPDNPASIERLEALLHLPEHRQDIAAKLEPVYRNQNNAAPLAEILEILYEAIEDPDQRRERLWEIFDLRKEAIADLDAAFQVAVRIFAVAPDDERAWDELEELANDVNTWEVVANLYAKATPSDELADPWRFELLRRLSRLYESHLERDDQARQCWELLLATETDDEEAISHLESLYKKHNDSEKLVDLLKHKATLPSVDDAARIALFLEVASILEDILDDPTGAIEAYRSILSIDPCHQDAYAALERLFERNEAWTELTDLLRDALLIIEDINQRHDIRFKLGTILDQQQHDLDAAIDAFRSILVDNPHHEKSRAATEAMLKRLAASPADATPEQRAELCNILEPIYAQEEAYASLVEVLQIRLKDTEESFDQLELNARIARLLRDRLEDDAGAFLAFAAALTHDLSNFELREALEALAKKLDAWQEVIELYEKGLPNTDDPLLQRELHFRVAQLYQHQITDIDKAIAAYDQVLALNDSDREALAALQTLHLERQEWEPLVRVLRLEANTEMGDARVDLLRRVATIQDLQLEDATNAIDSYREILENIDGDPESLAALERLYTQTEDWNNLIQTFADRSRLTDDPIQRRKLFFQMAETYEVMLEEPDEAIMLYHQALDLDATDAEALEALDRLYAEQERHADLAEILTRKLDLSTDDDTRNLLEFRLGQLHQVHLLNVDHAIELYRNILERDPHHQPATEALTGLLLDESYRLAACQVLEPIYETTQAWAKLVEVLELELLDIQDPPGQVEILRRVATLHQTRLSSVEGAFQAWARAMRVEPCQEFKRFLEDLTTITGDYQLLVDEYKEVIANIFDPEQRVELTNRIAELSRDQLDNIKEAEHFYQESLATLEDNNEALKALEDLYFRNARWQDLLTILEKQLDASFDPDLRRVTLFRMAQIQEEMMEDLDAAIQTYLRILEAEPTDSQAITAIKRLYRTEERWLDLVELLLREQGFTNTAEELLQVKFELGHVYMDKVAEDAQAVETFREILEVERDHTGAIEALERLFDEGRETQAVAAVLEPLYRDFKLWEKLIRSLESRLESTDDPYDRGLLLSEIATTWEERLGDWRNAFSTYGRLFLENPGHTDHQRNLERLALALPDIVAWANYLAQALKGELLFDFADKAPIMQALAGILAERLGQHKEARLLCEDILAEDPSADFAFDCLEWSYNQTSDWEALGEVWSRRVELSPSPEERIALLLKVAILREEFANDMDGAIAAYQRILINDPQYQRAAQALERLFRTTERFHDLADLYRRQLDFASDTDAQLDLMHRLGHVLEKELGQIPDAIDAYRSALEMNPNHPASRRALEALLRELGLQEGDNRDYRLQIATLLEPLYEPNEWTKLINVLEVQLEYVDDPLNRVDIITRQARLFEQNDPHRDRAFRAYARAFETCPTAPGAREDLERLADELGIWGELVPIYLQGVGACDDPIELVRILLRIAQINEENLGDAESAMLCYQQLLEHEPQHPQALDALERLYLNAQRFQELVRVLEAKADILLDLWERKDLYYRIAEIKEEMLNSPEEAIATYRTLLDIDDEDQTALDALERLYQQTQAWTTLVEIYQRKAELSNSDEERKRLRFAMANLFDQRLENVSEAIEVYRSIQADEPHNVAAIEALDRLFEQAEMWVDLLDILDVERNLAAAASDQDFLDRTEFRMAHLLQYRLDDVQRAIGHHEAILTRNPYHQPAREALELLLDGDDTREAVTEVLEPLYEKLEQWTCLVKLQRMKLAKIDDPFDRRDIMLRAALLLETKLDDLAQAFELITEAFKENPGEESIVADFERLADKVDDWPTFLLAHESLLADASDPVIQLDLALRAARHYEEHAANIDAAVEKYQMVIQLDPFHVEALANLDRLYRHCQQWTDLAQILERRIEVATGGQDAIELRFQLAQLKKDVFDEPGEAVDLFRQIIWDAPEHQRTIEALESLMVHLEHRLTIIEVLEPIYLEREDWTHLANLLTLQIEVVTDPIDQGPLLQRLGSIARDNLQDLPTAFHAFACALEIDPLDANLLNQLESLGEQLQRWDDLADAYAKAAARIDDLFARKTLHLKVARVLMNQIGDMAAAEAHFKAVIEAEPENHESLECLEQIYRQLNQPQNLLAIFEKRAEHTYEEDLRKRLLFQCADLALNVLHDQARGIEFLQKILELDDTDAEALDALDDLFVSSERWLDLLAILQRKADMAMDPAHITQLRIRIGHLAKNHLDDIDLAIDAFRNALDFEPNNPAILSTLEEVYVDGERWEDLRDIIMRRLSASQDSHERILLHMKLAALALEKFADPNRAIENLQQVLDLDASNDDALTELERVLSGEQRYQELFDLLERQKARASTPQEQIAVNIRIAQVAGSYLGDSAKAIESLKEVLSLQPTNLQAIAVLAGLYEKQGDYPQAMSLLNEQLELTREPQQKAAILVKMGHILLLPDGDPEQAEAAFIAALQHDRHHAEAIDILSKTYETQKNVSKLLGILEIRADNEQDPGKRRELLLAIATKARDEVQDYPTAVRALEQVFRSQPEDLETGEALLDAYIKSDDLNKAQPLLAEIIAKLEESKQSKRLPPFHHMRGQIEKKLGNMDAALAAFKAAYDINATYLPNLLDLGRYYFDQQNWDEALKFFQTMLLHQMNIKDKAMKVDIFYHLGMVRMHSGDARKAKDMFTRALSVDPNHQPSKDGLNAVS